VWDAVRAFALEAQASGDLIYTLQDRVANRIVRVTQTVIYRHSAEGRGRPSPISKRDVCRTWDALMRHGRTETPDNVTYFAYALMLAALPETLEYEGDGVITLK
jgi:hypothetical protein